jgi:hypothetical protein
MRGMLPPSEARMRMCVMKVGERGRWTYRDWLKWHFLWKFFPWYAREMHYRGSFCIGPSCMHWFWEDPDKRERGYCSVAVSRTQHMMWAKELEDRAPRQPAAPPAAAGNVSKFPSRRALRFVARTRARDRSPAPLFSCRVFGTAHPQAGGNRPATKHEHYTELLVPRHSLVTSPSPASWPLA